MKKFLVLLGLLFLIEGAVLADDGYNDGIKFMKGNCRYKYRQGRFSVFIPRDFRYYITGKGLDTMINLDIASQSDRVFHMAIYRSSSQKLGEAKEELFTLLKKPNNSYTSEVVEDVKINRLNRMDCIIYSRSRIIKNRGIMEFGYSGLFKTGKGIYKFDIESRYPSVKLQDINSTKSRMMEMIKSIKPL